MVRGATARSAFCKSKFKIIVLVLSLPSKCLDFPGLFLIYISQFQTFLMQKASVMIGSSIKTVDLHSCSCEIVFISKKKNQKVWNTNRQTYIYILELNGGKCCWGLSLKRTVSQTRKEPLGHKIRWQDETLSCKL